MGTAGSETTLADVRVGGSAVLVTGGTLDARQARRLVELGLRPGSTVRVMMRTAGGGRVLGVDNLRIVVDRQTLAAIPVTLPTLAPSAVRASAPAPSTAAPSATAPSATAPSASAPSTVAPLAAAPSAPAPPALATSDGGASGPGAASGAAGPARSRLRSTGRRLRLLGRSPRLTVLRGEPVGDGTE